MEQVEQIKKVSRSNNLQDSFKGISYFLAVKFFKFRVSF